MRSLREFGQGAALLNRGLAYADNAHLRGSRFLGHLGGTLNLVESGYDQTRLQQGTWGYRADDAQTRQEISGHRLALTRQQIAQLQQAQGQPQPTVQPTVPGTPAAAAAAAAPQLGPEPTFDRNGGGEQRIADAQKVLERLGFATDDGGVADGKVDGKEGRLTRAATVKAEELLVKAGVLDKNHRVDGVIDDDFTRALQQAQNDPKLAAALKAVSGGADVDVAIRQAGGTVVNPVVQR